MKTKKSLGQHFLRCQWVVQTLRKAAELAEDDTVLEIGPGTGVLTRALAASAGRVIAVEKDERLAAALATSLKNTGVTNVEIVPGDILRILPSITKTYKLKSKTYKLVANIPYYLTSRLIRLLLAHAPRPKLVVLTIQQEVAERIIAKPPHMNLLALSVRSHSTPAIITHVPKQCFTPEPKVNSAVIKISDISERFFQKNAVDKEFFFTLLRAAFSQKRKLLTNSLAKTVGKEEAARALAAAGLPPTARPQELSLTQWAGLSACFRTYATRNRK